MDRSPSETSGPRLGEAAWWLALAAAAIWVVYNESRAFDLWFDDPIALRPWTTHDVLAAFAGGRWEPWGVWDPFYRPLASSTYALAFWMFGLNMRALFVVTVADLAAITWLVALFVRRETQSSTLAVIAVLIIAVHPSLPRSVGTWFTNLPHGLATILALTALLYWQRCRTRDVRAWWPLALIVIVGFLLKEDMLMLAPALLALQALRAWWLGDVRPPSRALVLAGFALFASLFLLRWVLLGTFGGHELPTFGEVLRNGWRGPYYVLAAQSSHYYFTGAGRGVIWITRIAGVFIPALLAGGLAASVLGRRVDADRSSVRLRQGSGETSPKLEERRRVGATYRMVPRSRSWLIILGLALFAAFNVPQFWWSGPTAFHLLTLSASLALIGSISAVGPIILRRVGPFAGATGLAAGIALMAGASRAVVQQLGPCGIEAEAGDAWMQSVPQVPPEMRQALADRRASCAASSTALPVSRSMPVITWGVRDPDMTSGAGAYAWTADRIVAEIAANAAETAVDIRARGASPDAPVAIAVVADGFPALSLTVTSPGWHAMRIPLRMTFGTWMRGMHRLDLTAQAGPSPSGPGGVRRIEMHPIRITATKPDGGASPQGQ